MKLSITDGEEEGQNNVVASCSYLEEEFQECSNREGVGLADSVDMSGVDLSMRKKQLGAKEKARRRICDLRFYIARRNRVFQTNLFDEDVFSPCESVERASCQHFAHRNAEVEAADGSSSRQERVGFMNRMIWRSRRGCPPWPRLLGWKECEQTEQGATEVVEEADL